MASQVLVRMDDVLRDRLAAAAQRRGGSVQSILVALAEEFLATEESAAAKRVAAVEAWLNEAALDPYYSTTHVEERDTTRAKAWE